MSVHVSPATSNFCIESTDSCRRLRTLSGSRLASRCQVSGVSRCRLAWQSFGCLRGTAEMSSSSSLDFSSAFHKESRPFTDSSQSDAGFLLKRIPAEAHSADIAARCSACPARALRQSRRFLVILEGELPGGFLQKASSVREWLPGRCGLLTESSTHGRTGRRPSQCCRLRGEVRFAIAICRVASFYERSSELRDAVNSPMPRAWKWANRTFRDNNAVQVAGLDRICFAPWPSTPPPVLRPQQAPKIDLRVFFATITCGRACCSEKSRVQVSDQRFCIVPDFS